MSTSSRIWSSVVDSSGPKQPTPAFVMKEVEGPELLPSERHGGFEVRAPSGVGTGRDRSAAAGLDRGGHLDRGVLVTVGDDDRGALGRETTGTRCPDAATCTRHDRDPVAQSPHDDGALIGSMIPNSTRRETLEGGALLLKQGIREFTRRHV